MGRPATEGESPVSERVRLTAEYPEYRGTRETPWETRVDHHPSLNTT